MLKPLFRIHAHQNAWRLSGHLQFITNQMQRKGKVLFLALDLSNPIWKQCVSKQPVKEQDPLMALSFFNT